MPENHETNKLKTELVYTGVECDTTLLYSEPPRTGSRCSSVSHEDLASVSSPNGAQLEDQDDNHEIDVNVTQESKLTRKEICSNNGTQELQHVEDASNKVVLSENLKCSNGDIDLESNYSLHSIANQFSLVSGVLPFTVKDVIEKGEPHCENINMVREDQQVADIVCDILRLVNGEYQYGDKPLANGSNSGDQERRLKSELPNIYQMETTVPTLLIVSQDAANAMKESSSKEQAILALQGPAEDTNEMSPVLQDIPLVFQEAHSIAITGRKSSESTEKKENVCSIRGTHCITSMESVIKREVTEIIETRLIDSRSSSSGKPSASSLSSVNTHIMVKTHPDGGWGWVVCLGAFLVQFIALGMQNTAGIVYTELVKELKSPRGATAWVGSLATGIMFFLGPLTTSLCERLGCRIVTICGGITCILGLLSSSMVTSLFPLFFTYGVMFGTGTSLCYFPTIVVLSKYFKRRIAVVNGLVTAGSGVGTLVIGPVVQMLFLRFQYPNTFRIVAGIFSLVLLCGASYRPVPAKYSQYNDMTDRRGTKKLFDWSIFKNKGYVIWVVSLGIFQLGYFVPFVHLVRHAEDLGVNPTDASFLIGYMSVASTLGRLFFGKMADFSCVNRIRLYQLATYAIGLCSFLVPLATGYGGLTTYAISFGFFEACFVLLIPLVTTDIVGEVKMSYALGSAFTVMAFPMFLGPPIAGWMYDILGDYTGAFFFCGGTSLAAASVMFFEPQSSFQGKEETSKRRKILRKSQTLSNVHYSVTITTKKVENI